VGFLYMFDAIVADAAGLDLAFRNRAFNTGGSVRPVRSYSLCTRSALTLSRTPISLFFLHTESGVRKDRCSRVPQDLRD